MEPAPKEHQLRTINHATFEFMKSTQDKQQIDLFIKLNVVLWDALKRSPQPSRLSVLLADGSRRIGVFVGVQIDANRPYVRDMEWSGCFTLGDPDGRTTEIDFLDVKSIDPDMSDSCASAPQ